LFNDFTEKSQSFFVSLSKEEEFNVYDFVDEYYLETEEYAGFVVDNETYNIYPIYELIEFFDSMNIMHNDEELKLTLQAQLQKVDINKLNTLELFFILRISEFAEYSIDESLVIDYLEENYDQSSQLFFIYSEDDLLSNKLNITYKIYKNFSDTFDLSCFNVLNGIEQYYYNYFFKTPEQGKTFYNSGGDILAILKDLEMTDIIDISNSIQWFQQWEYEYDNFEFLEPFAIKIYADFLEVKEIFYDISSDIILLNNIYSGMDVSLFENSINYLAYSEIAHSISLTSNESVYEYLLSLSESIDTSLMTLFLRDYSLSNTFFGIMLSTMCNYNINIPKINSLLNHYERLYEEIEDSISRAKLLNYQIMIRSLINEDYEYNFREIENRLGKLIKELTTSINPNNVTGIRYIVEIYAFLNIGMDRLSFNRINAMLIESKKLAIDSFDYPRFDLFIIDFLLETEIYEKSDFLFELERLYFDNGFRSSTFYPNADIYTTFGVYRIIDDIYCVNEYLEVNKIYVRSLVYKPGIYSDVENGLPNLMSTYYGNIINYVKW
jgi:hypothetical protein